MQEGKGDICAQRRRRRDRYRGCRVCGVRGVHCIECTLVKQVLANHNRAELSLVVDGSYVESPSGKALGHGGAGLVLVRDEEILATRACGFSAESSSDAELHAVIRGARWVSDVTIYTDAKDLPAKIHRFNPRLAVCYLHPGARDDAYVLAHRLSVEGRCREAPETIPAVGLAFAMDRAGLTKAQRRRKGADLLIEHAKKDPAFNGDFIALAERLGWTSGRSWQDNPAIRIAADRWRSDAGKD